MTRRHGPDHHWSAPGPRLPNDRRKLNRPSDAEDIADPANGEVVPRCWACSTPNHDHNRLTMFALVFEGKAAGVWQLCERCYWRRNPPPTAVDPLQVDEVFAR